MKEALGKQGAPPEVRLVDRTDVARTRPALERAGYRCECCRHEVGLRVCLGTGRHVGVVMVLCVECRQTGGMTEVLEHRERKAKAERVARRARERAAAAARKAAGRAFADEVSAARKRAAASDAARRRELLAS